MRLKKRLIFILAISILLLAVIFHFAFNLSVYQVIKINGLDSTAERHVLYFVFAVLFFLSLIGILLYFFIDRAINFRIVNIAQSMKNIQGLEDLSIRIPEDSHKDEISSLITTLNETLDKLEIEKDARKKLEKTLISQEKLTSIGRVSSNIVHEINNPVLCISNCLKVLNKHNTSRSTDVKEALNIAEGEIKGIRNIVSGLLDFHRMNHESFMPISLNEIIHESLDLLKWGKYDHSGNIITELQDDYYVMGSKGKLKQVIINLTLNALEAVDDKNGEVHIVTSRADDTNYVEMHVFDNGPGVSPEIKDRIFEPFSTTKGEKGVGLGLFVVYNIVKNFSGSILYDDSFKEGAHFRIKLPLVEKEKSAANKIIPS